MILMALSLKFRFQGGVFNMMLRQLRPSHLALWMDSYRYLPSFSPIFYTLPQP
jgi:hypothetical protein